MAFKKYAKKQVKRAVKFAKKRYVKKGMPRMANIYRDVKMLKSLINIEKKRFDVTQAVPGILGQYNTQTGLNSGQFFTDITPRPPQGVGQGARIGNSLKVVSAMVDMQFAQQATAINDNKIKWFMVMVKDNSDLPTIGDSITRFFEKNPFSSVNDYYSSRDPEYFTNYRVIKTGIVNLRQDNISGGVSYVQQKCPLKLNFHLKFNTDASVTTTKNQILLFAVASSGDVFLQTAATIQYNVRWFYTDD